jgi:2-dehydropantoate 2-reductase
MHYVVLGAGAIGCYVGGLLAHAGARVTLVGRPRAVGALREHGIHVTDLDGRAIQVPAPRLHAVTSLVDVPQDRNHPCVILLCVKGGATMDATREIAAAFPPGTAVVSLQNGVENAGRIRAAAPDLEAIAGMVPFNVMQPAPEHAHRATSGVICLARTSLTESIATDFAAAGLPLKLERDMRAVQWGKLLLNLNNPVNALSNLPLREELLDRDYRRVLAALIAEALAVLQAAGIKPAKVVAAPPQLLPVILRLPTWLFTRVASRMLKIDPSARSSMWNDLQSGRVTEIDDLCGAIVRIGATQGVAVPANAALQKLVADYTCGQRYSGSQLVAACGLR